MINELVKQVHQNARDKGFYDDGERNIGEMLALIHSEVSEALEAHRSGKRAVRTWNLENNIDLNNIEGHQERMYFQQEFKVGIKDSFEDEICDVLIRVFDLAGYMNIDLEYHIKMKMAYNSTREQKHGKKY